MKKIIPLLLLSFFTYTGFLYSQNDSTEFTRPKIGLVLSGGGAKGIAHIGIIKALEEEGLRPDYIAGTSMGSIIGGLYALGYSADQLDTIIRSVNWDMVLSNNIPLDYIAYEEKEYYNRYLFEFPIEKGKLKLPSGMMEGQMLGEMLSRFCWPAKNYDSFDDFPIPFRCVATDVSTGKPVVFSKGSLTKALRASMAIPTIFTAVDLDTTLVVDGGVVNNFPVEELFNMGADYVIGVNVSHGFKPAYEIESMTGILLQISMIPSSERLDGQIEMCDLYIKPDLQDYSTGSFGNSKEILELGYISGEKFRPLLKHLADSIGINTDSFPTVPLVPDSITIESINITGNKLVSDNLILAKLQINPGDKVSRQDIEEGIRTIFGITNFKKVNYKLVPIPRENHYELTVTALENEPVTIKGSVHYDNIFKFGIGFNLTMRNILGKSSRTLVAGDISENPKFRLNYLKYMGLKQRIAAVFNYDYLNEQIPSYVEGSLNDIDISKESNFSLGLVTTQSLKSSLYLGIGYEHNRQKQKFSTIIPEGVDYGNFNFTRAEFIFTTNTFNDRNYPTRGREISVAAQIYIRSDYNIKYEKGVDTIYFPIDIDGISYEIPITENEFNEIIVDPQIPNTYGKLQFFFKKFFTVSDKFQIVPGLDGGFTLSTDSSALFNDFRIGGNQRVKPTDVRFLGLNFSEISYPNYVLGGLYFQNVLFKKLYLKYGGNLILPYEYVPLNDISRFDVNTLIDDYSIFGVGAEVTLKSLLGPISLGISRNSRDRYFRYYFAVGFSFNYTD